MQDIDRDHLIVAIDEQIMELEVQFKAVEDEYFASCECCEHDHLTKEMDALEASIANLQKQRREVLA